MSELLKRVLFSVVAAPLAIAIVWFGDAALATLLAVAAAVGAWELYRIARAGGVAPLDWAGIALAALVPLAVHAHYRRVYTAPAALWVVLGLAVVGAATTEKRTRLRSSLTEGACYAGTRPKRRSRLWKSRMASNSSSRPKSGQRTGEM